MSKGILFLAHRMPYPPNKGDRIRSWNVLRELARHGPVHLVAFADPKEAAQGPPRALADCCASVHLIPHRLGAIAALRKSFRSGQAAALCGFHSPAFSAAVRGVLNRRPIDFVYGFSAQMGLYLPAKRDGQRLVMDFVDCDSAKYADLARQAPWLMSWVYRREAKLLAAFEQHICQRTDVNLVINAREAESLAAHAAPDTQFTAMPNGVDFDYFQPRPVEPRALKAPMILFSGQMDYAPNVDAVRHFARVIFPRVRREFPTAQFFIVGRTPTLSVHALALLPGVRVLGEVIDVRPWFNIADVVVAPLRVARGVPNKILEAMAMARPLVTTPAGIAGLDLSANDGILLASDAEEQAAHICRLLRGPAEAQALGQKARRVVEQRFGWANALKHLPNFWSCYAAAPEA